MGMNVHPTYQKVTKIYPQYPKNCKRTEEYRRCEGNPLFSKGAKYKDAKTESCANGNFYKYLNLYNKFCEGSNLCCVPSENIKRRRLLSLLSPRTTRAATMPLVDKVEGPKSSLLELEVSGFRDDWAEFTTYVESSRPEDVPAWVLQGVHVTDDGEFTFRCSEAIELCNSIYFVKETGTEVQFFAG